MIPLRDSVPTRTVPVVTRSLILLNVIAFFFELAFPPDAREQLVYIFGLVPARLAHPDWASSVGFPGGAYLTLFTHQFLHGGWLHIISNMWALWIFGDNVEDRMGHARFGIFYILCGVLAALTHTFIQPDSTIPSVGASGAIAGVLGAYLVFFPTARIIVLLPILFFPFFFELPAVFYLGFWFFTQLFSGTLSLIGPEQGGGIAFWAHVGGFASGMLLCHAFVRRRRALQSDEYDLEYAWR
jgi:membrane associated rhomboid family serine protease